MKREKWITGILCVVFLVTAGLMYLLRSSGESAKLDLSVPGTSEEISVETVSDEILSTEDQTEKSSFEDAQKTDAAESKKDCGVYICGAVKQPGVYHFTGNARVCDAVEAAGGLKRSAASEAVNQARYLKDGEQLYIPTKKEYASSKNTKRISPDDSSSIQGKSSDTTLININRAETSELMTLPGIGEAKAQLIIKYRSEHGEFEQTKDIMKISGIKEGIFLQIKDQITV